MHDLSQEEIQAATDSRGIIAATTAAQLRQLRAAEQWERVDSVVIGEGARDRARGWFNTWAELAAATQLQWFSGRDPGIGESFTNQGTERTDWAQDLYQTLVEFIPPPGLAEIEEDNNDAEISPLFFTSILPNQMSLRVVLAESDEIAKAPASHFPSGFGLTYPVISGAAAPAVIAGNQGEPHVSNGWKWPEPVMLAAKAKITVFGTIDDPIRTLFRTLPGPGAKLVPDGAGGFIRMPNWYTIKITHRGPRYLQLRGARSSA